ncbi:MAG: hypothetical protein D6717_10485 [Gammaproteobacteria bacterium]|nr:MAG: hypothetical protein D6717_10485 [Gammaproteobacteria bacterium]
MRTPNQHTDTQLRLSGKFHSPLGALAGALLIALSSLIITLWQVTHRPWLGVETEPSTQAEGLELSLVWPDGPSAGILAEGDVVTGIGTVSGGVVRLQAVDVILDPDVIPTFKGLNRFLQRQQQISSSLAAPVTVLTTGDGRELKVQTWPRRPMGTLPLEFWMFQIYGAVAMHVAAWVWATARVRRAAMLVLVSGFAFLLSTASVSLIVTREIALPADGLRNLVSAFHLGNNVFSLALTALIWNYPSQAVGRGLLWPYSAWLAFAWLNERYQWMDLPGHNVGFQVSVVLGVGLVALVAQWWASRKQPAERAVVKFFLFTVVLINVLVLVTYYHAAWAGLNPLMPLVAGLGLSGLFYIALVIGVVRYRLFDVERWWLYLWMWLAAGIAILGLDILVSLLVPGLGQYSLVLVLVLVGWIYFPLRQWLWQKAFPASGTRHTPPQLSGFILRLVTTRDLDPEKAWQEFLRQVFSPLETVSVEREWASPQLLDAGERMYVPGLKSGGYELCLADHGMRLFHSQDRVLAEAMHGIARTLVIQLERYRLGVAGERERIMRDLHDDVGGRLLTLIHECREGDIAETAREALDALRDVIYFSMDHEARVDLSEAVGRWRGQIRNRLERMGVRLKWEWDENPESDCSLKAMEVLHLGRIMHEAVSNALRHAEPSEIRIFGRTSPRSLRLVIENDGLRRRTSVSEGAGGDGGHGTENMKRRAAELGGTFAVEMTDTMYRVEVKIPLSQQKEEIGAVFAHP